MTSLIDVIFLLLLFFMLTSTFSKYADVELTSTGPGTGDATKLKRVFLSLKPSGILLNGQLVALEDLPTRLSVPNDADQIVLVALSETTTSQELVDVLAVLRGVPDLKSMVLQ